MPFDSLFRPRRSRLAPGDLVQVAGHPVRLKVHARARRVSLRVDPARREIVATAPSVRALADAVAFAQTRTAWIAARLEDLPERASFVPGRVIRILGAPCRLERAAMRITPRLIPAREDEPQRLLAYGEAEAYARAVRRTLQAEALRVLTERTAVHAGALGEPMPSVAVMDAKARWGSCTPAHRGEGARIRYVWRLVLAPYPVLDYVAAHECAHLVEANHGPGFWAVVERLYGDPRSARRWLKTHGAALHAAGG